MIDLRLLPFNALVDTGVFILANGDRPKDARAPACREFVESMCKAGRDLMLSAPGWAEVLRGKKAKPTPLVAGITVVPFDRVAAELLGEKFPADKLLLYAKADGGPEDYYKYDAMIVACAERWGAKTVVSLDNAVLTLAAERGLAAKKPEDFQSAQGTLQLVNPLSPEAEPDRDESSDEIG